jgi:hypothetical protein
MPLFEIGLIAGLAVYRLTFMLNSETGPAEIFVRLRTRLGVRFDQHSNPYGTNWVAEGVLCFFCLSVWIAFAVCGLLGVAALLGHVETAVYILFPFALSGGAVYLKKAVG